MQSFPSARPWLHIACVMSVFGFVTFATYACSSDSTGSDARPGGSSGTSGGTSGTTGPGSTLASCKIFPNDNAWNAPVDTLPIDDALTASILPGMALSTRMHPDWGTMKDGYGIPITSL